jgi:hypothetical protein
VGVDFMSIGTFRRYKVTALLFGRMEPTDHLRLKLLINTVLERNIDEGYSIHLAKNITGKQLNVSPEVVSIVYKTNHALQNKVWKKSNPNAVKPLGRREIK